MKQLGKKDYVINSLKLEEKAENLGNIRIKINLQW